MSPEQQPPPKYRGAPHRLVLPEGTTLTRIHISPFGAVEFNPTVRGNPFAGGRFDSTPEDEYAYLYAADSDATAISETLLRYLPADDHGTRILHEYRLAGMRIAWINSTCDLPMVTLRSGQDLAAIGQDTWLTTAPSSQFPATRFWAAAIRGWAPWACGLTWRTNREPDGFAYIFFGDRCPEGCFQEDQDSLPLPPQDRTLNTGAARLHIEQILNTYRVVLMP